MNWNMSEVANNALQPVNGVGETHGVVWIDDIALQNLAVRMHDKAPGEEQPDDLLRYRSGHGAKNMAIVRRFALNLVRANKSTGSVKTKRKSAG